MAKTKPPHPRAFDEGAPHLTGEIIVRVHGKIADFIDRADEARAAGVRERSEFTDFLDMHRLRIRPLITCVPADVIDELEAEAATGPLPPLRSLNSYGRIDARQQKSSLDKLVERLRRLDDEVDYAYAELTAADPSECPDSNPLSCRQTYLDGNDIGIDARWMWDQPNGHGAGVAVVDVEQAWNRDHEDLVAKRPRVICGDNRHESAWTTGNHGTGVLGVLAATDNQVGVVGIAPGVASVAVSSRFHKATNTDGHVANAIAAAICALSPGDVVLVEVHRGPGWPTEMEPADFDAIRLAGGTGRVVVEAGGNHRTDLDEFRVDKKLVFNRASCEFLESGAIMVGAASAASPHQRVNSTFGSRIDCYAHGTDVVTTGQGGLSPTGTGPNARYGIFPSGTSSAAAIIAGAAILVQGRYKAINNGDYLRPLAMRKLLSADATGILPAGGKADRIGVMPDLRRITLANPALQD